MIEIQPFGAEHKPWAEKLLNERWHGPEIITKGASVDAMECPGFVAVEAGEPVGLLTYQLHWTDLQILTLDSLKEGQGIGTALVEAAVHVARKEECRSAFLVTSNDNMAAMRFYQKRGFRFAGVKQGAMAHARDKKPTIPKTGCDGIPIRDEIELKLDLE